MKRVEVSMSQVTVKIKSMTARPKFRYVFIPADCNEPIEERELEIPEGKDVECFLDKAKRHFSATSREQSEAQKQAQREQLLKQLGDAAKNVDQSMLNTAMNMQMVENICLLPNGRETGWVGVNMYCDDQAQLKGLEPNPRASQVAQCCGKMIDVRGDAFVARIFDNEDDFKRLDFTLQEVSSSAEWVAKAAQIAHRKQNDGSFAAQKDFLERMQRGPTTGDASQMQRAQVHELTPAEIAKDEGNAAFKKGDWAAAISRYSAALELDPSMLPALNNRALAKLKLHLYLEAEQDCSKVLEAEPSNVKALLRRASAREQQGAARQLDALADITAALRFEPSNKEALIAQQRLLPPPPPLPETAAPS